MQFYIIIFLKRIKATITWIKIRRVFNENTKRIQSTWILFFLNDKFNCRDNGMKFNVT